MGCSVSCLIPTEITPPPPSFASGKGRIGDTFLHVFPPSIYLLYLQFIPVTNCVCACSSPAHSYCYLIGTEL